MQLDGPLVVRHRLLEAALHLGLVALLEMPLRFRRASPSTARRSSARLGPPWPAFYPSDRAQARPCALLLSSPSAPAHGGRDDAGGDTPHGVRRADADRSLRQHHARRPGGDHRHAGSPRRPRPVLRGGPAPRLRGHRGAVLPLGAVVRRARLRGPRGRQLRPAGQQGRLPLGTGRSADHRALRRHVRRPALSAIAPRGPRRPGGRHRLVAGRGLRHGDDQRPEPRARPPPRRHTAGRGLRGGHRSAIRTAPPW